MENYIKTNTTAMLLQYGLRVDKGTKSVHNIYAPRTRVLADAYISLGILQKLLRAWKQPKPDRNPNWNGSIIHFLFKLSTIRSSNIFAKTLGTVTGLFDEHDDFGLYFFRIGLITAMHKLSGATQMLKTI